MQYNYCIISLSDQRKIFIDEINKELLDKMVYHDIEYVDANNNDNIKKFFSINKDITETRCYKKGFIGHYMSQINVLKYCIKNNIDNMLILEDDAILCKNFYENFINLTNNLPKNFDFFVLFKDLHRPNYHLVSKLMSRSFNPVEIDLSLNDNHFIHPDWDIKNDLIVKAYQKVGTVGYLVSLEGCKKILKIIEKNGFGTSRKNATSYDEILYFFSKFDLLKGYQVNPYYNKEQPITTLPSVKETPSESTIRYTSVECLSDILEDFDV